MKSHIALWSLCSLVALAACGSDEAVGNVSAKGGAGGVGTTGGGGSGGSGGGGSAVECGNGTVDVGEACDDGNTTSGDGCSATCASDESCGNDTLDPDETCDDGNTRGGDGCSATCVSEPIVTTGGYHGCALFTGGTVKCWGFNGQGQLGIGDKENRGDGPGEMGSNLQTVDLGTGRTAVSLAAGSYHTCALLDDGSVKCWGDNEFGKLGLGDTAHRGDNAGEMGDNLPAVALGTGRKAVALAAGNSHTCALLDDDSLKCWGFNVAGQLGLGDTNNRGDGVGEMGDNLPAVALGTSRTAKTLALGGVHTCALLDDDSLKCWGNNADGQLGFGDANNRGDNNGEMGSALPTVDLGTGRSATTLAAGSRHTCALLDNDALKCWGNNTHGRLGLGDINNRGDGAGEMGDQLLAVDLGAGLTPAAIATGNVHSCALFDDGSLKCWGRAIHGQLGLGDTESRGDLPSEMGSALPVVDLGTGRKAVTVSRGADYTCALLDNSALKCWGDNGDSQLGLGDTEKRGDGPGEMGDNLPAVDLGL